MSGQCEAEQRNQQAAYEIELQWGAGRIDLGRIKNILTGRDTEKCSDNTHKTTEHEGTSVKLVV